eukprot:COSAG04_NODE_12991_length_625_cov_0.684411_1_plen_50_part_10
MFSSGSSGLLWLRRTVIESGDRAALADSLNLHAAPRIQHVFWPNSPVRAE